MHPQRRGRPLPGTGRATPLRHRFAGCLALLMMSIAAHGEALDASASPGKRLAVAADCVACHSTTGGKPFAGGYPLASPMGVIYSTNITPSKTAALAITARQTSLARCVTA